MKGRTIKVAILLFMSVMTVISGVLAQDSKKNMPVVKQGYKFDNGKATVNKEYIDKILTKKMDLLQQYLSVLIEKKKKNYASYVDSAMLLFNNDETKLITVTSSNTGKIYVKPVREYLADVSKLPYKSVNVTYRNYTAIENIRRQPDGTYRGIAVIEQEFTGYNNEGNAIYNDIVRRDMEVVIKIRENYKKDYHLGYLYVFFGHMGVTEFTSTR